jgi:hypothetical protein
VKDIPSVCKSTKVSTRRRDLGPFDQKAAPQLSNSPTARSLKQTAIEVFFTCGWQTEEVEKPSQSLSQATEASGTKEQRMPCPQSRRVRVPKKILKVS